MSTTETGWLCRDMKRAGGGINFVPPRAVMMGDGCWWAERKERE